MTETQLPLMILLPVWQNNSNFESFMPWYSQPGTPEVGFEDEYDPDAKVYTATFTQNNLKTPFMIPNRFGLIGQDGHEIKSGMVVIDELVKTISFENIPSKPTPSWFRGFSAPIKFNSEVTTNEKIFLVSNDTDPFNRWDQVCLLYTSPSPRDMRRSRMPSSA